MKSSLIFTHIVRGGTVDLFRFRTIPHLEVTTEMRIVCGNKTFEITSVEDVKGRGMYIEVLAKEVESSG